MTPNPLSAQQTPPMRSFITIWTGQAISLLGSQLVQFAMVWYITRSTGSATMLAMATLAALLPQILIGPFAGTLVDRWNRRKIMILADGGVAIATMVIAILFWLQLNSIWMIFGLLMLRAVGAAFQWPAMQASTTLMVPNKHLARVAGINQALVGAASIFIPVVGALAVEAFPLQFVLAIDVITALPAILTLLFASIPQPVIDIHQAKTGKPSIFTEMRYGLNFILNWKALMLFALQGILINLLGQAAGSLSPLLVMKYFHGGAIQLGWFQSANGIGVIIGGLFLGLIGVTRRRMVGSFFALALDGFVIILIALCPQNAFLFVVIAIFLSSVLECITIGLQGAAGQAIIPPEMQGRVFSLMTSLNQSLAPLGLLIAGPFADAFGVQQWWLLAGIMIAAMGIIPLFIPAMVHIEENAHQYYKSFSAQLPAD